VHGSALWWVKEAGAAVAVILVIVYIYNTYRG
jgi:hypothetical protein